ncbi:MAG TPA: hypothetical protein VNE38_09490, partial [Ktedonobacteraceae bacterium]|nr:hypothetical protein [Ktedonobacteraceae bacterium]
LSSTAFTGMSPLVKRYETLAQNDRSRQPLVMKSVIDTIRKRISQVMLQSIVEGDMMPNEEEMQMLAANAFAAWGQLLWEGKNTELDQALSDAGVLQKIAENSDHLALAKRLLGSRTSPFARNINTQQVGDLYVLLPPAPQTRQFRQIMNLPRRHFVEFPDVERLVLLYVHNYMSESLLLAAPEEPENLQAGTPDTNGNAQPLTGAPPADSNTPPTSGTSPDEDVDKIP